MSEMAIADACLLYLSQEKYSQLITKRTGLWVTASGEDLSNHHLLTYSAKYWDKHLDEVQETPQLFQRVEAFLTSPNFQTTLQIQSLYVEGHFGLYMLQGHVESHKYTKRVFPKWLSEHRAGSCTEFSKNYRSFISEWQPLLDCGTGCEGCYDHAHYVRYAGELDRCLWKALGPRNFLSSNRERYYSFMLSSGQNRSSRQIASYYEAVSADGKSVVVMQSCNRRSVDHTRIEDLQSSDRAHINRNEFGRRTDVESSPYHQEIWNLPSHATPTLLTQRIILTDLAPEEWRTPGTVLDNNQHSRNLKIMSFSPDLSYLRIESQMFAKDSSGGYIAIDGLDLTTGNALACFEDITSRGSLLVLASRQRMPTTSLTRGRTTDPKPNDEKVPENTDRHLGLDLYSGDCDHCSRDPSRSKSGSNSPSRNQSKKESSEHGDSTNEYASSSSSTESLDWNSAEETWSEASTDVALLEQLQWKKVESSEEESSAVSDSEGDSEESEISRDEELSEGPVHSYGQLLDEDESDGGGIDLNCGSEDDAYQGDSDGSDLSDYSDVNDGVGFDSDDEYSMSRRLFIKALGQRRSKYPEGCLMIYDVASKPPNLLFRFSQRLPLKLYDSPPAIHPTRPLVVWPSFGGDILFVDYEAKSYFTRRARTSTRKSISPPFSSVFYGQVLIQQSSSPRIHEMQLLTMRQVSTYGVPRGTRNAPLQGREKEARQTLFIPLRLTLHPPALNA